VNTSLQTTEVGLPSLFGKTALVTGGSRGLGRASALALAEAGAQVLVHYGSADAEARAVVDTIRRGGGRALQLRADMRTPDGPHVLAAKVREIIGGRLDVLVANAGISKAATIEETTVEDFDNLAAVNVRAPFFLVQQLLPIMCKGSSVILVSSLVARSAGAPLAAYAATKGAVEGLMVEFAAAFGGKGIRVNAIAPGVVDTELSNFTKTDAGRARALGLQVFQRIATPADIASTVVFLASDAARWVSGEALRVDGGSKL
jgi:3-oxoacyl-[acyl-carrier protein] reductase